MSSATKHGTGVLLILALLVLVSLAVPFPGISQYGLARNGGSNLRRDASGHPGQVLSHAPKCYLKLEDEAMEIIEKAYQKNSEIDLTSDTFEKDLNSIIWIKSGDHKTCREFNLEFAANIAQPDQLVREYEYFVARIMRKVRANVNKDLQHL